MEYEKWAFVSLSHLLRMAVLSQRAVDYATKAYELRDLRFNLQFQDMESNLRNLQRLVAERGRILRAAGSTLDDHSVPGSCILQIYSGLQITFVAAREIAQRASSTWQNGQCRERTPRWREAARFVNSLVTLNTVALVNRQRSAAELVLRSRDYQGWPAGYAIPAGERGMPQVNADASYEECVAMCLKELADQAFEIACSIVRWPGPEGCSDRPGESAVSLRQMGEQRRIRCTGVSAFIAAQVGAGVLGFAQ